MGDARHVYEDVSSAKTVKEFILKMILMSIDHSAAQPARQPYTMAHPTPMSTVVMCVITEVQRDALVLCTVLTQQPHI